MAASARPAPPATHLPAAAPFAEGAAAPDGGGAGRCSASGRGSLPAAENRRGAARRGCLPTAAPTAFVNVRCKGVIAESGCTCCPACATFVGYAWAGFGSLPSRVMFSFHHSPMPAGNRSTNCRRSTNCYSLNACTGNWATASWHLSHLIRAITLAALERRRFCCVRLRCFRTVAVHYLLVMTFPFAALSESNARARLLTVENNNITGDRGLSAVNVAFR